MTTHVAAPIKFFLVWNIEDKSKKAYTLTAYPSTMNAEEGDEACSKQVFTALSALPAYIGTVREEGNHFVATRVNVAAIKHVCLVEYEKYVINNVPDVKSMIGQSLNRTTHSTLDDACNTVEKVAVDILHAKFPSASIDTTYIDLYRPVKRVSFAWSPARIAPHLIIDRDFEFNSAIEWTLDANVAGETLANAARVQFGFSYFKDKKITGTCFIVEYMFNIPGTTHKYHDCYTVLNINDIPSIFQTTEKKFMERLTRTLECNNDVL